MRKVILAILVVPLLGSAACTNLNDTQQRTLTGGVGGAGVGALLGAIGGNAGLGAAAGAGAGLLGGFLYDRVQKDQQAAYDQGYQAGRYRQY
jgi:uncharacterized membrane protein